jgi:hypothetical protein
MENSTNKSGFYFMGMIITFVLSIVTIFITVFDLYTSNYKGAISYFLVFCLSLLSCKMLQNFADNPKVDLIVKMIIVFRFFALWVVTALSFLVALINLCIGNTHTAIITFVIWLAALSVNLITLKAIKTAKK